METFDPKEFLSKKLLGPGDINFHEKFIDKKTVLGFDIYKYSEYPSGQQEYIPVIFNELYHSTFNACFKNEKFFFQTYCQTLEEFKKMFISTGDGGFQIFNNPLQAVIFAAYFQTYLKGFNSNMATEIYEKNLRNIVENIDIRYAITHDDIYKYDDNFYGPSIINNSRILSKDNLNRLLTDSNTIKWFDLNINSVENLLSIKLVDFLKLKYFKSYILISEGSSILFKKLNNLQQFKSVDVLKIGKIRSKNKELDIYNLKLQFSLAFIDIKGYNEITVTLGNLNTQGIN